MSDPDGTVSKVKKIDFNTSREVMGIFRAPSGSMKGQITKIENKIIRFHISSKQKVFPPRSVWTSFWGKF